MNYLLQEVFSDQVTRPRLGCCLSSVPTVPSAYLLLYYLSTLDFLVMSLSLGCEGFDDRGWRLIHFCIHNTYPDVKNPNTATDK